MVKRDYFHNKCLTITSNVSGGNFMGMMNVLMQLRKVCNHPDLFEPRPITTPYTMDSITFSAPSFMYLEYASRPCPSFLWPATESASLLDPLSLNAISDLMTPEDKILNLNRDSPHPLLESVDHKLMNSDPRIIFQVNKKAQKTCTVCMCLCVKALGVEKIKFLSYFCFSVGEQASYNPHDGDASTSDGFCRDQCQALSSGFLHALDKRETAGESTGTW